MREQIRDDRFRLGQLVRSKAGHDLKKMYVVVGIEDDMLCLADGRLKSVKAPKRKKKKHVWRLNYIDENAARQLKEGNGLDDESIIQAIKLFEER